MATRVLSKDMGMRCTFFIHILNNQVGACTLPMVGGPSRCLLDLHQGHICQRTCARTRPRIAHTQARTVARAHSSSTSSSSRAAAAEQTQLRPAAAAATAAEQPIPALVLSVAPGVETQDAPAPTWPFREAKRDCVFLGQLAGQRANEGTRGLLGSTLPRPVCSAGSASLDGITEGLLLPWGAPVPRPRAQGGVLGIVASQQGLALSWQAQKGTAAPLECTSPPRRCS